MNLSTLNSFSFEAPDNFNLYRDDKQKEKFFLDGQNIRIFEIKYVPEYFDGIFLKLQFVEPPKTKPTKPILKSSKMLLVYKQSNILNRQTIGADPLYSTNCNQGTLESIARYISWPKKYTYEKDIAAVITNFGQCDILEYNSITRTYENSLISLNNLFTEIFSSEVPTNFDTLKKSIEDNVITTCSWLVTNNYMLMLSTISGLIFIVHIDKTYNPKIISQTETNIYKINNIKSFQYLNDKYEICYGVIVSNINGLIMLYKLENDKINEEPLQLWTKEDKMSGKQIEIHFDEANSEIIICTSKSFHFLVLIVSTKSWTVVYKGTEFCKGQISNFEKLSKDKYVVCTLIGQIKHLTLLKSKDKYSFKTAEISHNLEIENYNILGMVASENKVAWMFILCPDKTYMLGRQKYAASFSICTFNAMNPLDVLKQYDRSKDDSKKYVDCYEMIRLKISECLTVDNIYLYDFQPIVIDFNFVHRLRVRLNIVNSIIGYNIKKTRNINETHKNEFNNIKLSIKAIYAYWRLLRIIKDSDNLSNFQKLSLKCLRNLFNNYLNNENLLNTPYNIIREKLMEMGIKLIEQSEEFYKDISEICNFCFTNTDVINENCLHDLGRCCISNVQINSLEMKYCEGCGDISLNDEELLKQVMFDEDDIRCPICDYYLTNDNLIK